VALAGFAGLEAGYYVHLVRGGGPVVAAVAGAAVAVGGWFVLRRVVAAAAGWSRRHPAAGWVLLALGAAGCWLGGARGEAPRLRAEFSPRLQLARVGEVTRPYEALLSDESPVSAWSCPVARSGQQCEVFLYATGRARVLASEDLQLPMRRWHSRVLSLEEFSGQKGRLSITTASPQAAPYHVFCSVSLYERRAEGERSVLLISLDGLRADHLGCYGYVRATSPWIDRLAEQGVRFENCNAQAPWSLPSLLAILSGEYPSVYWMDQPLRESPRRFFGRVPTLPSLLRARGYHTAAVCEGGPLEPAWGLYQGFDTYIVADPPRMERTFRQAADWLAAHADEKFLLLVQSFAACPPYSAQLLFDPGTTPRQRAIAGYDTDIVHADTLVGLLLGELRRLGIEDRTVVVVTSAHGQDFQDLASGPEGPEGTFGHTLRQSVLHVPLIIRAPGLVPAGRVVKRRVAAMDITPTVLELLGAKPLEGPAGMSLKPLIEGAETAAEESKRRSRDGATSSSTSPSPGRPSCRPCGECALGAGRRRPTGCLTRGSTT